MLLVFKLVGLLFTDKYNLFVLKFPPEIITASHLWKQSYKLLFVRVMAKKWLPVFRSFFTFALNYAFLTTTTACLFQVLGRIFFVHVSAKLIRLSHDTDIVYFFAYLFKYCWHFFHAVENCIPIFNIQRFGI